ncbi:MAG: M67 family metallopeptidase [Fidelibacterota bacterium]
MTETVMAADEILTVIPREAEKSYPEEGCGFLYGHQHDAIIEMAEVRFLENQSSDGRTHRYRISPEQYLEGEKFADEHGLELVGIYHSHPDHPAIPSRYDLEWALPSLIYLIVSVQQGRVNGFRWWKLSPDRTTFEEIRFIKERIRGTGS